MCGRRSPSSVTFGTPAAPWSSRPFRGGKDGVRRQTCRKEDFPTVAFEPITRHDPITGMSLETELGADRLRRLTKAMVQLARGHLSAFKSDLQRRSRHSCRRDVLAADAGISTTKSGCLLGEPVFLRNRFGRRSAAISFEVSTAGTYSGTRRSRGLASLLAMSPARGRREAAGTKPRPR